MDNGVLMYQGEDNGYHIYYGDSFWGTAHYYFTKDLSRLNIRLKNGAVYVYEKAPAPAGVLTSAKIKQKPGASPGPAPIYTPPAPVPVQVTPASPSITPVAPQKTWIRCSSCNGTGRCSSCRGTGLDPYTGRGSLKCMVCYGTGNCAGCRGVGGYWAALHNHDDHRHLARFHSGHSKANS